MTYAVETCHLSKTIDDSPILNDITMGVKQGEIYGFLGANGAGKTSLMKTLYHIITPDAGTITLLGERIEKGNHPVFSRIGSIIESPAFYQHLSARENLELHCGYMGGMPEELVFDQDSIVCVSENAGDIIYTYEFEKFRQECGLSIRMCRGADPESKGKIENVVKYIKGNFLSHRLYVDDGILNGPQLMAEIGDVTRFAHRSAITSFAGVDPGANQSGTHKAKSVRTSKSGSPELRKALFLVMDCLIQTKPQDDPVYQFMDKKRAEDKPYLVCMTAGANKFLRIHYGRVKEYLATLEGNPAPDSGERT